MARGRALREEKIETRGLCYPWSGDEIRSTKITPGLTMQIYYGPKNSV
jgi:hypothetical protein